MKRILACTLLCLSFDICSNPGKKRDERNAVVWQKKNMPFTNPETQRPYNFTKLSWLALLCGPVVMLESALRPKTVDFQGAHLAEHDRLDVKFGLPVFVTTKVNFVKVQKKHSHR